MSKWSYRQACEVVTSPWHRQISRRTSRSSADKAPDQTTGILDRLGEGRQAILQTLPSVLSVPEWAAAATGASPTHPMWRTLGASHHGYNRPPTDKLPGKRDDS